MPSTVPLYVTIAGPIFGFLALTLGLVIAFRQGTIFRPRFRFSPGMDIEQSTRLHSKKRKLAITNIILCETERPTRVTFCKVLYELVNTGRHAVKNVRLTIQYPSLYEVTNDTILQIEKSVEHFAQRVGAQVKKADTSNYVRTLIFCRDWSQVEIELPIIRPGETVIIGDMMCLNPRSCFSFLQTSDDVEHVAEFAQHLTRTRNILDFTIYT